MQIVTGVLAMPRVRIHDQQQYEKAIDVLTRVGGTYQGVGQDEWYLLVTNAQYQALLKENIIASENGAQEQPRALDRASQDAAEPQRQAQPPERRAADRRRTAPAGGREDA